MTVDETGDGSADRRTYLKALGTLGAAGLAGCAGDGGDGGDGGGGEDGGDGGGAAATDWSYDGEIDQAFVSPDNLENDIWQTFLAGAEEAAAALGLTVDYQGHGGQESQQISQLQSAISAGADILTGTAYQNSGVRSVAETAAEGGVPFTSYWTMANWWTPMDSGPEFLQYQIPEVVRTGAATARVLFEAMGGSGNFVHITGVPGHVGSHRNAGVEQAMEDYPDIERLGDPIPSEALEPLDEEFGETLSEHETGDELVVERVSDRDPDELAYLSERGITPDSRLEVVDVAPIGMVTVAIDGEEVSLPDRVAELIHVRPVGQQENAETA